MQVARAPRVGRYPAGLDSGGPVALWTPICVFGLEDGFPLTPLMAFAPYVAIAGTLDHAELVLP